MKPLRDMLAYGRLERTQDLPGQRDARRAIADSGGWTGGRYLLTISGPNAFDFSQYPLTR